MCADNSGLRGQNSAGRKRPSAGAASLFDNRSGRQLVRPAFYVGRVGALAVALGVGTGILGFSGAAAADTGSEETAGSTGRDSARSGASRSANGSAGVGPRRSPRGGAPAPAQAVEVPPVNSTADNSESEPTSRGRRSGGPRSGAAVTVTQGRKADTPARAVPAAPGDLSVLGALLSPGGMQNLIQDSVVSLFGSIFSAVSAGGVVPELASTPQVLSVPQVVDAVAIEPPVMTAAAGTLAEGQADQLESVGEGGTGVPGAEPFAWAALAVTRREDLAGAKPEVAPAAVEGTPAALGLSAKQVTPASGYVGDTIQIAGAYMSGIKWVKFGCSSSNECGWGVITTPVTISGPLVTVKVPEGAPSGYLQIGGGSLGETAITTNKFTNLGALPSITEFGPASGSIGGSQVVIKGTGFTDVAFISFNGGTTTDFSVNPEQTEITAFVADQATTGPIVVGTKTGGVVSATKFTVQPLQALPTLPTCTTGNCNFLEGNARIGVINQLSLAVGQLFPSAGPVGRCTPSGCPIPLGQTAPSVANTIGEYAFNIVYLLTGVNGKNGQPTPAQIGNAVVELVTQPNVLNFISQTVAGNKLLANAPQNIQNLVGDAVASFVQNTLGNPTVAEALVPFLLALNLPSGVVGGAQFAFAMQEDPKAALLGRFDQKQQNLGQAALQTFFQNSSVQDAFGAAFTTSTLQLLGVPKLGQPQPAPVLADYLGQVAASALLRKSAAADNPLAVTIGNAVETLFNNIGLVVATDAGDAFVGFLNEPALDGQLAVATTLANNLVNEVVRSLGGSPTIPPSSLFGYSLAAALAPAAGVTATGLVNSLLSSPAVTGGLGQFLTDLVPGILGDQQIQDEISAQIVSTLGQEFGTPVANTVVGLLADTTVTGALTTFVNTTFGTFLGSFGVVPALADAAGTLTTAQLSGNLAEVLPQVEQALKDSPVIASGVNTGVSAAAAQLLGNTELWDVLNNSLSSLVATLLTDTAVQDALAEQVAIAVELRITGPLGVFLGDQLGSVVVALVTNPVVQSGLLGVVDTLLADFWQFDGVVDAFSQAAGVLASAALTGDLDTVAPEVAAQLQANLDVQGAVQTAFGDAMAAFLGDSDLWAAVDGTLSAAVISLTTDPDALAGLEDVVSRQVEILLGGPLGEVVGPQVGAAVVALVSNPVVAAGLLAVVDTLFSDFFSAPGVVDDFSTAASQWALVLLTTGNLSAASAAARQVLKFSDAVDNGVDVSVTAAVAELLDEADLWSAVDQTVSSLVGALLTDQEVQDALAEQVAIAVELRITGPLGVFLGEQLGTLVVELVTNPVISSGLLEVVNTLAFDFWSTDGVVDAFSQAAGVLAKAALTGDLDTVAPEVVAGLRSNIAVQAAAEASVGAAVSEFLSDTNLWTAVDGTLSAAVISLTTDPDVLDALGDAVSNTVSNLLGGDLGAVVGPQVGAAVVALLSSPAVVPGLLGVVDTLFSDFIGTPDVVDAFSVAAGQLALVLVTGGDLKEAVKLAQQELRNNPAIDIAMDVSVTAAVSELLGDINLWQAVDQTVSSLVGTLLTDQEVQQALNTWVAAKVADQIPGPVGQFLGEQLGTLVVELVTNPVIQLGLLEVFDTLSANFWGWPGVVDAFSGAAGTLASAALTGDLDSVTPEVAAQLRANLDVQGAVENSVGAAVAEVLGDRDLWSAVNGTLSAAVISLTSDPVVLAALEKSVADTVGARFGPTVGAQVGAAVVALVSNPAVVPGLLGVVDTLFSDFFGAPDVVDAFSAAASQWALVLLTTGDVSAATAAAQQELRVSDAVDNGVDVSVTAAVTEFFGDGPLWTAAGQTVSTLLGGLLADSGVQNFVGTTVTDAVTKALDASPIAAPVGQAVGAAVQQLLGTAGVPAALGTAFGSLLPNFLGASGVADALGEAAGALASAALTGDLATVIPEVAAGLRNNTDVQDAVGLAVTDALGPLLGDTGFVGELGASVTSLVTGLLSNSDVQLYANTAVTELITKALGQSPIAGPVGVAIGEAVQALLGTAGVDSGLGTIIGSLLPDFLDSTGVPAAVADAAGILAIAVLTGDLNEALPEVAATLLANPDVVAALKTTIADALGQVVSELLSVKDIQQELGTIATTLIEELADNAAVQAFVAEQLGAPLGPIVAGLLANTAVVDEVAVVLGSAVTGFLSYPGFSTALAGAIGLFADDLLDGTSREAALQAAVQELQSDPAFIGAVNAVVPFTVNTVLSYSNVRQAIGSAARDETVALLAASGVDNRFVQRVAGQLVEGTVEGLLTKRAGKNLIGDVTVNVLLGLPLSEVSDYVVREVLHQPVLQIALGASIGQGIGSLFGDNIIGDLVGLTAGLPAAAIVVVAAAIINIYQWLFGGRSAIETPLPGEALHGDSHFFQLLPAATDLYVVNATWISAPLAARG